MGCVGSRQPRHIPLVELPDDPWNADSSVTSCGIPLKVVVVGDEGVGKTSFILCLTNQKFDVNGAVKTIGIDFWRHVINIDGENISLQIWDTAGDTRFTKIAEAYYKSAHGFFCCFSITDKNSFHRIPSYVERIQELNISDNPVILLVGTKCDSREKRKVGFEEAQQIASQYNLPYFEISSKDNINVVNVVLTLIKLVKENSSNFHMLD